MSTFWAVLWTFVAIASIAGLVSVVIVRYYNTIESSIVRFFDWIMKAGQ